MPMQEDLKANREVCSGNSDAVRYERFGKELAPAHASLHLGEVISEVLPGDDA